MELQFVCEHILFIDSTIHLLHTHLFYLQVICCWYLHLVGGQVHYLVVTPPDFMDIGRLIVGWAVYFLTISSVLSSSVLLFPVSNKVGTDASLFPRMASSSLLNLQLFLHLPAFPLLPFTFLYSYYSCTAQSLYCILVLLVSWTSLGKWHCFWLLHPVHLVHRPPPPSGWLLGL